MSNGPGQPGPSLGVGDFLSIGSYNLVCVLAGMGLGWWADASSGWTPVLTLAGLAVGVMVGVLGTWLRLRPLLGQGTVGQATVGTADGEQRGPH